MTMTDINHSRAVAYNSPINAGGSVYFGDIINAYIINDSNIQDLVHRKDKLEIRFVEIQQRIKKYPEQEELINDLLIVDKERNEVSNKIDELKYELIKLYEVLAKIPINTQRLKLAQQQVEAGDFTNAKAILNAEQMAEEQASLLRKKTQQYQQLTVTEDLLVNNSNEFLFLARLTAADFNAPNRYENTILYFDKSLAATHTFENTREYANYLYQHNQLTPAITLYNEAVVLCMLLVNTDSNTYMPEMAKIQVNLGIAQLTLNDFPNAQVNLQQALGINKKLVKNDPQTYLPDVAITLINIAVLKYRTQDLPAAEYGYHKVLKIYRSIKTQVPDIHLPDKALALSNLATVQLGMNKFPTAEKTFKKALCIYSHLSKTSPMTYQPNIAGTMGNMAIVHIQKKDYPAAEQALLQALQIYIHLAEVVPHTYSFDEGRASLNLSKFYQTCLPHKEKSLFYATEAMIAIFPFTLTIPEANEMVETILVIVINWGKNTVNFLEEIQNKVRHLKND